MITAIAIDDEPLGLQVIKEFCRELDFIDLVAAFTSTGKALDFIGLHKIDLVFLDIEMPMISGIELYQQLPEGTAAIFTTAYPGYAVEGFNLNAIDYLLKPFDLPRFQKAMEKVKDHFQFRDLKNAVKQDHLLIKADYGTRKIALSDIRYIEGQDNYLKIHLDDGKYILVRMALKLLQQQLPEQLFVRVHRSYIVSAKKVTAYRNRMIYLADLELPTSGLYLEQVNRMFGSGS